MQTNVSARKLRNIGSRSRADAVFPLTPTLSPRACHYPQVRLPFLNPKGIVSSSPGLRAASYPGERESSKHPTPTGLRLQATTGGRNPVGVGAFWSSSPRVARCSQPWAGGHNPFGIEKRQADLWVMASPWGEGESCAALRQVAAFSDGRRGTLSFGERAGVRGNWTHAISTGSGALRQVRHARARSEEHTSELQSLR